MTDFYERYGGRSPNSAGFSFEGGGRAVHTFVIGDKGDGLNPITSGKQIHDAIREILGFCEPDQDNIKLHRTLPLAHPVFPWMYPVGISNIVGLGRGTVGKASSDPGGILESDPFPETWLYPTWELTVEFAPRPYAVAPDDSIEAGNITTWTKPDGSTETNVAYAKEWDRFTDVEFLPAAEWITAEAGGFKFDVNSGSDPNNRRAGKGQLKTLVQQSMVKLTWFQVPYSYIHYINAVGARIDSYILDALGHVNQFDWNGFSAGTLLLTAVNVQRYTPPVPSFDYWQGSKIFTGEKLCNITFLMLHRDPTLGKDAAGNTATPSAAVNANAIQAGHNYMPLAHMSQWYYAKTTGISGFTNANDRPAFPSYPFELMFKNPGVG